MQCGIQQWRSRCSDLWCSVRLFAQNTVSRACTVHPELAFAGRVRSQKEVEKQIADLNIQLDNLCQFLPQVRSLDGNTPYVSSSVSVGLTYSYLLAANTALMFLCNSADECTHLERVCMFSIRAMKPELDQPVHCVVTRGMSCAGESCRVFEDDPRRVADQHRAGHRRCQLV